MSVKHQTTVTQAGDKALVVERVFDAPRELVWEAWTKPEHVSKWWGHAGVPLHACEIDLRVGGSFRYVQKGGDGVEYPFVGTYREILVHERLNYTMALDIAPFNGNPSVVTDKFESLDGGKTRLTMHTQYDSAETLQGWLANGAEQGAIESLDRFAQHIAKMRAEA